MTRATLDGKVIDKTNVVKFVNDLFTKTEIKRMKTLSRWHKKFDKNDDEITHSDCDKFLEIWKFHLRAKMITKDEHVDLIFETEARRPKVMSIDEMLGFN